MPSICLSHCDGGIPSVLVKQRRKHRFRIASAYTGVLPTPNPRGIRYHE